MNIISQFLSESRLFLRVGREKEDMSLGKMNKEKEGEGIVALHYIWGQIHNIEILIL
jgi:hypothetical protein